MKTSQEIKKSVAEFYDELPFSYHRDTADHVERISTQNQVLKYEDLHGLLKKLRFPFAKPKINNALEVGCGAGWFTNTLAYHYGIKIKAIDMTEKAIERSKEVARFLGLNNVDYIVKDLFMYDDQTQYDLVCSLGVLHHTYDCKKAFLHVSSFVKPTKYIYIGLYHLYGRKVFLEYLQEHHKRHGEEAAFQLFMELNPHIQDSVYGRSWFRDQVLHPHETQHTLEELAEWFDEAGFRLISTSVNKFEPFESRQEQQPKGS